MMTVWSGQTKSGLLLLFHLIQNENLEFDVLHFPVVKKGKKG